MKSIAIVLIFGALAFAWGCASSAASGEVDCDDYYYGIRRSPDLARALKCYEAEKMWEMSIVMHLNGEGTPASVAKAEELLMAWQKADPSQADSRQVEALRKIIDEHKRHPGGPFSRIDFCRDIAGDTVTMNACAALDGDVEEAKLEARVEKLKKELAPPESAALVKLVAEFEAFKKAEGRRMYQQSIDGTIRGMASLGQEDMVREDFLALMGDMIEQRGLQSAGKEAYEAADRKLNQAYQEDVRGYTTSWEDRIKDAGPHEDRNLYRQYIQDYKADAKNAQLHWTRYRDLWAELARLLYKDQKAVPDPVLSMKAAVTQMRVIELKNDPVGPGNEGEANP
jgi:uncharacterized protein YecT (DUF1311 family)